MTNPTYDEPEFVLGEWNDRPTAYDALYFIRFFAAIPEERWYIWTYVDPLDSSIMCALGHCGNRCNKVDTYLAKQLIIILPQVDHINDNEDGRYPQSTPKRRILAALRDVACAQLKDEDEDV